MCLRVPLRVQLFGTFRGGLGAFLLGTGGESGMLYGTVGLIGKRDVEATSVVGASAIYLGEYMV